MAKFANCGYGSEGQGIGKSEGGYTYVVNNNVRTGQTLQLSVKHAKSQRIFGTTGKVLSTAKDTSVKGQEVKRELEEKEVKEVANAYTGKELGATRERGASGKFSSQSRQGYYEDQKPITRYQQQVRGGNILARQQQTGGELARTPKTTKAVETFESYSKQFMPKGDEEK